MNWIIAFSAIILIAIIIFSAYKFAKYKKKKPKDKIQKTKKPKKVVKQKIKQDKLQLKGSYCDTVDKFLYRKEVKLLIVISKILPKEYVVFPKIGIDTILEPVGSHALFDAVKGKYLDFVIFEQETMKPKLVIDVFDGSIGDEQLDQESPEVFEALKSAELPVVTIKVKTDYDLEEIKNQIWSGLGIAEALNENAK